MGRSIQRISYGQGSFAFKVTDLNAMVRQTHPLFALTITQTVVINGFSGTSGYTIAQPGQITDDLYLIQASLVSSDGSIIAALPPPPTTVTPADTSQPFGLVTSTAVANFPEIYSSDQIVLAFDCTQLAGSTGTITVATPLQATVQFQVIDPNLR